MGGPFLLLPTLCHHNSGTWCPTGSIVPQLVLVAGPFSGGTNLTGWSEFGMATMRLQKIGLNVKDFQSEKCLIRLFVDV